MESVVRNRASFVSIVARCGLSVASLAAAVFIAPNPAAASSIEAIHGKTYTLSSKHGPWMIMVNSFWGETPEEEEQAAKAATELVYQLRKRGVPAYTYQQDDQIEEVAAVDRLGRPRHKKLTAQHGMIGVLAGNYHNADDKVAKETLKFIKKLNLKVTAEVNGKQIEWPVLLVKAFMTRNPLLSAEEMSRKNRDPLIVRLNSGVDHSLFENRGKYTLVVASFNGQSSVKRKEFENFDRMLANKAKISLDNAAREAWELMTVMRKKGIDAYIYHERYRSIVTVGAFKSPNDPEAARLTENFRAKEKLNPATGQMALIAESIQIPGKRQGDLPLKAWMMDPYPKLIEVP
jgi:hypothetical protein